MLELSKLGEAIRHEGGVSRRLFLAYSASLASLPLLGMRTHGKTVKPKLSSNPFGCGIASGDPTSSGVVLWTRLAPNPLEPTGGMEPANVEVLWEIGADESMRQVLKHGTSTATPQLAHSVHVEVEGLAPDRWYWYRFRVGDAESVIGRTRTLPTATAAPSELKFAFASCQHYEAGLYTAYRHMADEDLDLVLHLGDYIYEGGEGDSKIRRHTGGILKTLDDYRIRHGLYKSDPHLQTMHARCPWMVTWDDHEVSNDYANDQAYEKVKEKGEEKKQRVQMSAEKFLQRRAAAYQAYYEMMPLRQSSLPRGPQMTVYRNQSFGQLANLLMLDGRQYRSAQPNNDQACDINGECLDPKCSMLGAKQHEWLENTLANSAASWNVLAQQTIMATVDTKAGPEHSYSMDAWCGYLHERNQLMGFLGERKIANPIVLTGDNHNNWVNNLRADDRETETPVVATEFVGTSISSGGDGSQNHKRRDDLMADNPAVRYFNSERGYVRCTVTPKEWRSDFRTVATVEKPGAPITTRATFVVEAGQAGANEA